MLEKNPKELKLSDLEELYLEAETCDKRVFAEMRTNLQLIAGEHYVREGSKYWNRIRDNKSLSDEQRLKLTKNHIQRIMKIYCNAIQSASPGVAIEPKDMKSLQHQKAAELNYAVVQDWKSSDNLDEKIEEWVHNFFEIGEVAAKVFWEPNDGQLMGYEAKQPEELPQTDEPMPDSFPGDGAGGLDASRPLSLDDFGMPAPEPDYEKPVYSGKVVCETIYGYNLKRDPNIGLMKESPYLFVSKMTSLSAIRAKLDTKSYDKLKSATSTSEYTVFDNNSGTYRNTKNQILLKECYFRPTPLIPKGFFYIFITDKILAQGELPQGIFPIVYEPCEKQTGNARGHSPIRHVRPSQIELNRCASKVAEHQISIGDDKVYIPNTMKLSQGATLPGVRVNNYSPGQTPLVVPGRTGDQYIPYMEATIKEMYQLAQLDEVMQEEDPATDIYSLLYRNLRYKKKFTYYSDKFERFLCKVIETALEIAKDSMPEEALIPAIGKSEYINIPEFKSADKLCYRIKVEPRSDDVESQMGKQLSINHFLQYAGANISRQDIGMAMRVSPFLNREEMFKDFTMPYDNVTNDILALDRGQFRPPRKNDDHEYVAKKLASRMNQEDYNLLPPQVQQLYEQKLAMHEQMMEQKAQALQAAEAGFIPSGGYLVKADYYINSGKDGLSTKRVSLPSESISWLLDKLQKQGNQLNELTDAGPAVQGDVANLLLSHNQPGPAGSGPQMGPTTGQNHGIPNGQNHLHAGNGAAAPFRFPG